MIWYSQLRATKYNRIQQNYPRLTPPREHANATTKAYANPRDWSVHGGDTKRIWCKANSTGKPELAEGWRLNLSAFPPKGAPHAEWNNEIERAQLFLLFPHLKFK